MLIGGENVRTCKYPIISSNNKKYLVVVKRTYEDCLNDYLTCYVFKMLLFIPIPVYKETTKHFYVKDLRSFVRSSISSYEYSKGYGMTLHNKLDEFKQWDGNLNQEIK